MGVASMLGKYKRDAARSKPESEKAAASTVIRPRQGERAVPVPRERDIHSTIFRPVPKPREAQAAAPASPRAIPETEKRDPNTTIYPPNKPKRQPEASGAEKMLNVLAKKAQAGKNADAGEDAQCHTAIYRPAGKNAAP